MAESVPNRAHDPKRQVAGSKPCAWCGKTNMDWNASFNGVDICNDCAGDPEASCGICESNSDLNEDGLCSGCAKDVERGQRKASENKYL